MNFGVPESEPSQNPVSESAYVTFHDLITHPEERVIDHAYMRAEFISFAVIVPATILEAVIVHAAISFAVIVPAAIFAAVMVFAAIFTPVTAADAISAFTMYGEVPFPQKILIDTFPVVSAFGKPVPSRIPPA